MANPEASDLAWLAGIIDGEGSICARFRKRKSGEMRPFVDFALNNTNWLLMAKSKRILQQITGRKIAIGFHRYRDESWLDRWQIAIGKKKSLISILIAVMPYLCGKKQQAIKAIKLCEWNCRRLETVPSEMVKLAKEIKFLNHNPPRPDRVEAVETGHVAPEGEGTVQPLIGISLKT